MSRHRGMSHNVGKGFVYSLFGAAFSATSFVTGKYALRGFNTETFSLVWSAASALYALLSMLLAQTSNELALRPRARRRMLLMGVSTGIGMMTGWAGVAHLDPAFASFLWRLSPVLTIMASAVFLKEKLMPIEVLPLSMIILGGSVSTLGRWDIVSYGVILVLISCTASALQMLVAKSEIIEVSPQALVFYRGGIGAVTIAIWALLVGDIDLDVSWSYWVVTLVGSFLSPWASFLLVFRSYQHWSLSRSTIIQAAQPLFVLPLAFLLLHSLPTTVELIGGCAIMVGAMWLGRIHWTKTAEAPPSC